MSPEGCHHLPTHSRNNTLRLATATNHQVYEDPCDACINALGVSSLPPLLAFIVSALHAVPTPADYPPSPPAPCNREGGGSELAQTPRQPKHIQKPHGVAHAILQLAPNWSALQCSKAKH